MDGLHFDALSRAVASGHSRRRVTRLLGGLLLGSPLVLTALSEAEAKRKGKKGNRRTRRKKKPADPPPTPPNPCAGQPNNTPCNGNGRCQNGTCVPCNPEGATCAGFEGCCSLSCDFLVAGGTCSPCRGRTCNAEFPCCGGLPCTNGYCGGCRDRGAVCADPSQCCFSECFNNACLSPQGGKCLRNVDCWSCYLNTSNCPNACVNGSCTL